MEITKIKIWKLEGMGCCNGISEWHQTLRCPTQKLLKLRCHATWLARPLPPFQVFSEFFNRFQLF